MANISLCRRPFNEQDVENGFCKLGTDMKIFFLTTGLAYGGAKAQLMRLVIQLKFQNQEV